jgi:glycosyltransferase involved in cell wall biosynthesis
METVFHTLAYALRRRGHHVDEVHHEEALTHEYGEGGDVWGLPLRMIRTRYKLPILRSVLESLRSLLWVAHCLRRSRPDVVDVHYVNAYALYFILLRPLFKYRLVLSAHGSDLLLPSKLDRALLPHMLRRADAVTVVSEDLQHRALSLAPSVSPKLTLVPNGIDLEYWTDSDHGSRQDAAARSAPPVIVSVGRLEHVKGHDVLLRSFAEVSDRVPGARLVLVGDGSREGGLRELARSLGVADLTTFTGTLSADEIRTVFRGSAVFVLPSRSEGMGLALMEAMAAGLPAVASAVGGVPEVAGRNAVWLVPPEDPATLAGALVTLLSSGERRDELADRGRCRVEAFSRDRMILGYERIFSDERVGSNGADLAPLMTVGKPQACRANPPASEHDLNTCL